MQHKKILTIIISSFFLSSFFGVLTAGAISSALAPYQGGTGIATTTPAAIGNCLKVSSVSNYNFSYVLGTCGGGGAFSTSTVDYWLTTKTTDNLTQGSTNKYWSNTLFDNRLSATTSLPNIITLSGLSITKSQVSDFGTYENPLTFSYPFLRTTNAISWQGLASSSALVAGNLLYATGVNTYGNVATGTVSSSGGITTTAGRSAVGGSLAISCDVASDSVPGCMSAADHTANTANTAKVGVSGGTAGMLTAWTSATGLTATGTPTADHYNATSTTNSSLFPLFTIGTTTSSLSSLTTAPFVITGNQNGYIEGNIQNLSNGGSASSEYTATNNIGNASKYYITTGINSSGYNNSSYTITGVNDGYLFTSDAALAIGTASSTNTNAVIKFHTGGTLAANERMRITQTGNVGIGTTTPYSKLSVWGADTLSTRRLFELTNSASTSLFYVNDDGTAYLKDKIGFGTTSPYANTSISGTLTQKNDVFAIASSSNKTYLQVTWDGIVKMLARFVLPISTTFNALISGETGINTGNGIDQLKWYGTKENVLLGNFDKSFSIASTTLGDADGSTSFNLGTSTKVLWQVSQKHTVNYVGCSTDKGIAGVSFGTSTTAASFPQYQIVNTTFSTSSVTNFFISPGQALTVRVYASSSIPNTVRCTANFMPTSN